MSDPRLILNIKGSIAGFAAADVDQPVNKLRSVLVPPGARLNWGSPPGEAPSGPTLETIEQLPDGYVRYTQWRLPTGYDGRTA